MEIFNKCCQLNFKDSKKRDILEKPKNYKKISSHFLMAKQGEFDILTFA